MENKQSRGYLILSNILTALLAVGVFVNGLKIVISGNEVEISVINMIFEVFAFVGFIALTLYISIFYKKDFSPAFFRGLLIFTVAFMTYGASTLGYENFIGVFNCITKLAEALLVGIVASRLSRKKRNRILLIVAAGIEVIFCIAALIAGVASDSGASSFAQIISTLSVISPTLYMITLPISFISGSYTRHSEVSENK